MDNYTLGEIQPTVEYIMSLVPLRYPVLLVDRVHEWTPGERIVAAKCFTAAEPIFGAESPGLARPPEAMMTEAMVQVAGLTLPKRDGKYVYLLGLHDVVLHAGIEFGDVMTTVAQKAWLRGSMFRVTAHSTVDGRPTISGAITFAYHDSEG